MRRLFVLAILSCGILASCSKNAPQGIHFGSGPGGEEQEDMKCK